MQTAKSTFGQDTAFLNTHQWYYDKFSIYGLIFHHYFYMYYFFL